MAKHLWGVSMKFHDRSVVALREMEGAATGGDCVIDLAEARAARDRTVVADSMRRNSVFQVLELQTLRVSASAELMIAGMTRFIGELNGILDDVCVARTFCMACQDACELEDIDAMIAARDRLQADFAARSARGRRPTVE
jgi:hypothetical protein